MSGIKVLVVDDEPDFVELFLKRFAKRGLSVRGAGSGAEALAALSREPADVVVLDVKMPGMDGLETLREIKKRHPAVQVILLTGHGSVKSGIEGMSHGAYDYVLKPFSLDDLLQRILAAFERRRMVAGAGGAGGGRGRIA
ncbi:sigma-54 dependent transcriptional regulator [Desulfovibrio sp. X2]|uniref:sigma-54-dependent transcriptional regulator n=1 Tax=Desulfovibrio sp. X2 TaxID=941449 RepID=UPI0006920DDD|nr:response regulator [Desulfovibrio sp. X2]